MPRAHQHDRVQRARLRSGLPAVGLERLGPVRRHLRTRQSAAIAVRRGGGGFGRFQLPSAAGDHAVPRWVMPRGLRRGGMGRVGQLPKRMRRRHPPSVTRSACDCPRWWYAVPGPARHGAVQHASLLKLRRQCMPPRRLHRWPVGQLGQLQPAMRRRHTFAAARSHSSVRLRRPNMLAADADR